MLKEFRAAQLPAVERLRALEKAGILPPPHPAPRPPFAARLSGKGAIIAEYKRASPSAGPLNLAVSPEEMAYAYAAGGAAAISVLTEERHFQGRLAYLERMSAPGLPLLRKDFLIHPLQVRETAATPASSLLLIVRLLQAGELTAMLLAAQAAGLEAVLEIFDSADLWQARRALADTGTSPAVIQVNSRDLRTLAVDAALARALIRRREPGEIWISASGVHCREEVEERRDLGFNAILIGSCLMSAPDPRAALAALAGGGP
ncbi:MAG: indole-3-glycerol-phosphate synthase [Desulfovibrio sp.]|jgi:indole-3-glycerol phosphate synthase|nr:indole-3-glycerol-phosphate synthase [Desulfovibrio sp.]